MQLAKSEYFATIKMYSHVWKQLHEIWFIPTLISVLSFKEVNESRGHDVHPQLLDMEK